MKPLGIRPTVDFAFKKIFGSPQNSVALIGLLNAILEPAQPIESVEVLNPFSYREFAESKQIVLDVRCRETTGRWLNVEMQVAVYGGLLERLVYYAGRMYVDQLEIGQNYANAAPAISICLLEKRLFKETEQAHHRFQMIDVPSGRKLENGIEVHTVELSKYNWSSSEADGEKLAQWAFFLLHAQEYDGGTLRELMPDPAFEQAIATIETISGRTEDRQMYDQREKAIRDYEWALSGAREEGREEGREHGKLLGRIQTLQELLGESVASDVDLRAASLEALQTTLATLQQRIRNRTS